MHLESIHTDADLAASLARVEQLWDAAPGTTEIDELEGLSLLVARYEAEHSSWPPSDPREAIKFRMDQQSM